MTNGEKFEMMEKIPFMLRPSKHCVPFFAASLGSCFRNPLNNLGVIPGKLAIPPEADQPQAEASATRNPEKSKTSGYPLSRV